MMATTTTSGPVNHENIPTTTTYKAISSSCSSSDLVPQQQEQQQQSELANSTEEPPHQQEDTNPNDESAKQMEVVTEEAAAETAESKTNGTNGTTTNGEKKEENKKPKAVPFKVEIPRISSSRDLRPQRPHSPTRTELLEQVGFLLNGSGADRDLNKTLTKIRSVDLEEALKKARKYAMEQSVRYALVKQQQQQQKQQLDLIKKQQAILLMCRIYVGSIFYEVKEEQVRSAFGQFGPIRSISMSWDAVTNKHKGFAFIEFETPEAAQLSLDQMNGSLMGGRNIKVGRPSNMPQAQPIIDGLIEDAKRYHRIYISSIHPELTEQDVKSVFEAFGSIKTCGLARDLQTGKHKGYGFIEYDTAQAAQDAINSMNLFDLGGQLLRVGKAITPPETVTPPNSNLLNQPFGGYAGAAAAATSAISALNPSIGLSIPSLAASGALNTPGLASKLSEITSGGSFSNLTQLNAGASSLSNSSSATTLNSKSSSSNLLADSKSGAANQAALSPTGQQSILAQMSTIAQQVTIQMNNSAVLNSIAAQCQSPAVLQAQAVAAAVTGGVSTTTPTVVAPSPAVSIATPAATVVNEAAANSGGGGGANQLTEGQRKLLGLAPGEEVVTTLEQQSELTVKSKEQRLILMKKLMSRQPESRVVVLRNMVGPEDVDDELETEITDECEKFGQVEKAIIYQEKQGEEEDAEVIVKIFVEFASPQSVETAVSALNGRYFAGRRVRAEVYDQIAYDSKDYSG